MSDSSAPPPPPEAPARIDPVEILGEVVAQGSSGLLRIEAGKLRRIFCFTAGRFVFAASNLIEEQLDEALVRGHMLTPADRATAKAAAAREGMKLTAFLRREAVLEPALLERAASEHYVELLRTALTTRDAETAFDRGQPRLDGELTVDLSCLPILLAHTRVHPSSLDAVRVKIGPPNMRPTRTERAGSLVEGVELDETAAWLASRCDGGREIADLIAASPGTADGTLRALRALLLAGVLTGAERKMEVGTGRDRVTRDELEARLDRAIEADHYGILGLERDADEDGVRDAYYYLARRYHPDRFRVGPLQGLMARIETYFAQVTEAYNTLIDAGRRAAYDEELAARASKGDAAEEKVDRKYIAKQNYLRARALIGKRQYQAAVPFLENAIEQDDDQAEYHLELGRVLTRAPRRRDEAESALQRAAELSPASVESYIALGHLYALQQRTDDAGRMYREALRWKPGDPEARAGLAELGLEEDPGASRGLGGLFKGRK